MLAIGLIALGSGATPLVGSAAAGSPLPHGTPEPARPDAAAPDQRSADEATFLHPADGTVAVDTTALRRVVLPATPPPPTPVPGVSEKAVPHELEAPIPEAAPAVAPPAATPPSVGEDTPLAPVVRTEEPAPAPARPPVVGPSPSDGGPSDGQLAALRACESGGDYTIVSAGGLYRGAYQFDQPTWDSVASRWFGHLVGVDPSLATPAEQDAMARSLYAERGWQPWPTCARGW